MKKLICTILLLCMTLTLCSALFGCALLGESNNDDNDNITDIPGYTKEETEIILLNYKEAQNLGFEGTLEQFLDIVKGKDGKVG